MGLCKVSMGLCYIMVSMQEPPVTTATVAPAPPLRLEDERLVSVGLVWCGTDLFHFQWV